MGGGKVSLGKLKKKNRRKDHKKMNNKFHRDKIMGKEEKNRKNS